MQSKNSDAYAEDLILDLIQDEIFETAIDTLWLFRTKQYNLDTLYNMQRILNGSRTNSGDSAETSFPAFGSSGSSVGSKLVICNVCGKEVAGSRYAPHLERCMSGGKRGVRKHYELLADDSKKLKKEVVVDPFPNSTVVRVKLKGGVPSGSKQRIGVSLEEFNVSKALSSTKSPPVT